MESLPQLAVPKGSLVLVTGANGLLGSHIADQFLTYGYKVRGTVRDPEKNSWLVDVFEQSYGKGSFELVKVSDMAAESAFDEAVKGVSIVAHSASIMSFDYDPNIVITPVISGAVNALKAAYAESSVKRFVFTSSTGAVVTSTRGAAAIKITEETWNEDAVKQAWAEPPFTPERAGAVYCASKTQAEQEIWKYHKEHHVERPDLVVNTVLPNVNFGKSVDPVRQGFASSAGWPVLLRNGQLSEFYRMLAPQYFIDVQDTGRLHVAAGIFEHVQGQRIFGTAYRFSWDSVLDVLRKLEPEREFPDNFSGGEDPNEVEPRDKAEQLLRQLGRPGWTTLEDSIRGTLEDLELAEKAGSI
ncbi:Aldehyde reductase 2 [Paramyrothecium foliicola]|nr:Aldehyde reductase 2 [Paramyrothecium foliicola]